MAFSVGIGLTNECNLRCPHCYRPNMRLDRLTLHDIRLICESIPVQSMNLGVGENGFHPEYRMILEYLAARGIKTSITSNSASIRASTPSGSFLVTMTSGFCEAMSEASWAKLAMSTECFLAASLS